MKSLVLALILGAVCSHAASAEGKCGLGGTTNGNSQDASGTDTMVGSTEKFQNFDYYGTSSNTSLSRYTNQTCNWYFTCPAGSSFGYVDLEMSFLSANSLTFSEPLVPNGTKVLDIWNTSSWHYTSGTKKGRRGMYSPSGYATSATTVGMKYEVASSGSTGYGIKFNWKCFTTKCPADLVTIKTSATQGFSFYNTPVPGTECTFSFTCPASSDIPVVTYQSSRGGSPAPADYWSGIQFDIKGTTYAGNSKNIASEYTFSVPINSSAPVAKQVGDAADTYQVTYKTPTSSQVLDTKTLTMGGPDDWLTVWAGCQTDATGTECPNELKNNSVLTNGWGVIRSDPSGTNSYAYTKATSSCLFNIQCGSTATGVKIIPVLAFTGSITGKVMNSTGDLLKSWSKSSQGGLTYTYPSSTVKTITLSVDQTSAASSHGAQFTYNCLYPMCNYSSNSGLHDQTHKITNSVLERDKFIPMTSETVTMTSAVADGATQQSCVYTVSCPTGMYVMVNVTGYWLGPSTSTVNEPDSLTSLTSTDPFDLQFPTISSYRYFTTSQPLTRITKSNTLSFRQISYRYTGTNLLSRRASVAASLEKTIIVGCTTQRAETCPYSLAHFSDINSTNSVTLNTYAYSGVPVGIGCAWPISCPSGTFVTMDPSTYLNSGSYANYPDRPYFKTSDGHTIAYSYGSADTSMGVQSGTLHWNTTVWNTTNSAHNRGWKMIVSCTNMTGAPTPIPTTATPVPPITNAAPGATPNPPGTSTPTATVGTSGTPSPTAGSPTGSPGGGNGGVGEATASGSAGSSLGASVGACHYTKVAWPLTEGIRHRMEFNWGSSFTLCNFVFSCPKTTTGIAFKMTKVVPLGSFLSVAANASSYDTRVYNRLNALTYLSSSDDVDLMVDAKMALKITGWGTGGSFAVQATCMTEPQVPLKGAEVNYVTKALYTKYSTNYHSSLDTFSKIHRAFRPYALYRRRAYGELEKRAFLISCKTSDMTTNNLVVQLKEVIGTTGSGGDVLKITAVDSGNNTVYQAGTIHSTYARTNDTNVFSASSQYYVTWTSDNINETSTGLTISYYCGEAPWVLSGIGNSVSSDPGSGNGASGLGASVWVAVVAALAILTLA